MASTMTSKQAWDSLLECYQGKGVQSIVLQIGALFQGKLSNEELLESQLNVMVNCSHILTSLGIHLDDSIIASAIILALPESYSTLQLILTSTSNKPIIDSVKNLILTEECSCITRGPMIALKAQFKGKPKKQRTPVKKETEKNKVDDTQEEQE